jgi:hypothetical protein
VHKYVDKLLQNIFKKFAIVQKCFVSLYQQTHKTMDHLLLLPEQYEALRASKLIEWNIDYARFNDPSYGVDGSGERWVVVFKLEITATMAFNLAYQLKF